MICHSGGATGSDLLFEELTIKNGGIVKAYSYKTKYHNSIGKTEISESDYIEGVLEIENANKILKRKGIYKYMNLLARNWSQVKYGDEIFAIGTIVNPGENGKRYINKSKYQEIDGGTGYAVKMGILHGKPIYVYDQNKCQWFKWSYIVNKYLPINDVKISEFNFTGIGTRDLNECGKNAIKDLFNAL